MGLVHSALQIGRSALLSYQGALQVVGNNIANAGRPDYTRQSAILTGIPGPVFAGGFQPGNGVALSSLKRNVDEALQSRLRTATSDQESITVVRQGLSQIESILNELSDTDVSTLLNKFFGSWTDLQSRPHDLGARQTVLTTGAALATELQRQRGALISMTEEYNARITDATSRANELASELADLNVKIVATESAGGAAGGLKDKRDADLAELSQIVSITTREQPSGAVNVYVGNEPLVFDGISRGLETRLKTVDDIQKATVVFSDNKQTVQADGGELEGLIVSRDTHILPQLDRLDTFAHGLIQEVNRVHSSGQGLDWLTDVTGTYAAEDATAPLNSATAGLEFPPKNGSFLVKIRNEATGQISTTLVEVDLDGIAPDTTLETLRDSLNAVANLNASITADNRLQVSADAGFTFSFAEDSSGALAAAGINTFFDGVDAHDIMVNNVVAADPQLLAAASDGLGLEGDGGIAGQLGAIGDRPSDALNGVSLFDYYGSAVTNVAVSSAAAQAGVDAADVILTSLRAQRESVSGVSLDEEAVNLAKFQRSFQGSARYVTVVDELIGEMLSLVR